MNFKTFATIIGLLAVTGNAFATRIAPFTTFGDLTKTSPDIIIARCVTTPEPHFISNGMIWSDIEVLNVLKGDTKPRTARMVSQYWPRQGEQFLIFSTYQTNQHYQAYNATERYRIVPIGRNFITKALAEKHLHDQIQIVLRQRLEELNRELTGAEREKNRLVNSVGK